MIEPGLLGKLIEFGRRSDIDMPESIISLSELGKHDQINRLHWSDWDAVTRSLPTTDVVVLVKALTLAERTFKWAGGSVAAAIWIFKELERRDPNLSRDVADWILPRTENPYVPFGSTNYGAKSVREYEKRHAERLQRAAQKAEELEAERERAKLKRSERKRLAQERTAAQEAGTKARQQWLEQFMTLSEAERLRHISLDREHPPDFYPIECANVSTETLKSLDPDTVGRLKERLGVRRKGPWRELYKKLIELYPPSN